MVKNTVQRDEKRVIIYYTFEDEQQSASGSQHPAASAPARESRPPTPGSEATHE